jgi:predicted ATPase/class 3 adenylate cyclase
MICIRCTSENREGRHFCAVCGVPLPQACAACGFANHPGENYCGRCGIRLAAPPSAPASAWLGPDRRPLTVMFCDLVGSTSLSTRLDPEDLRELVRGYQECCAAAIARYDGYISRFMGDGILVFFGYPTAQEDAPERAVRAALAILEQLSRLHESMPSAGRLELGARIGIATGLVVAGDLIGEGAAEERAVVGETPNLAARLQSVAPVNGIALADQTHRLVSELFECEDLGEQMLKGFDRPQRVWRALAARDTVRRFEAVPNATLPGLVGRRAELDALIHAWERARDGEPAAVLVCGDAGIGKSRLVQELRHHTRADATLVSLRCSRHYGNSALYPILEFLKRAIGFEGGPPYPLEPLEAMLACYDIALAESVPLLGALLSVPLPERYAAPLLSPQRLRQRSHQVLCQLLTEQARKSPVVVIWEDIQWADPSSLEVLSMMLEPMSGSRELVLLTARAEFEPPPEWFSLPSFTRIELGPLTRTEVLSLVERVAGEHLPARRVLEQLVERADGVPLFAEELTRMVVESATLRAQTPGVAPSSEIPASLHDSLMARLDRLASVKELAQVASALGRIFSEERLREVTGREPAELRRALDSLIDAQLLLRASDGQYSFRHALIQDAAYQSMLRKQRRAVHQKVADALLASGVQAEPEIVALHLTEAGDAKASIPHWRRAGDRARAQFANVEALHHYRKALELLLALPADAERAQQELALLVSLGLPLTATQGYAAAEVGEVYGRARELALEMGEQPQLFPILHGLYRYCFVRADLAGALQISERLQLLAEKAGTRSLRMEAYRALGFTLSMRGDAQPASEYLERSATLYDPALDREHVQIYGTDPFVASRSNLAAAVLVGQGRPRLARTAIQQALTRARELGNPFNIAWTLSYAAVVYQQCNDVAATDAAASECVKLSSDYGMAFWLASGMVLRGWALARSGNLEEGTREIARGIEAWRLSGARVYLPYYLCLWAQALADARRPDEGLAALDEGFAHMRETGERWWAAELERTRAELLAQLGSEHASESDACFARAVDTARTQGLHALELRARLGWQRVHPSPARIREIATLLDGLDRDEDTAELREASALVASTNR